MPRSSPPSVASDTASKADPAAAPHATGSISRRLVVLAIGWITLLLVIGGFALETIVAGTITRNFDEQLARNLPAMMGAVELDANGDAWFNRSTVDPRFDEPYSGYYWQVSTKGRRAFRSRSLWDRELEVDFSRDCIEPCITRSERFRNEPLRIIERDGVLPGSSEVWRFQVAQSTEQLDEQLRDVRRTLWWSLGALGAGLIALAALQATFGLMPLKRLSSAIAAIRSGSANRVPESDVPPEVAPLVQELNALLDHNEQVAEEARMHAGNLAHALKTPISVLMNEASADSPDLSETVVRELTTMRRHIDHHLARARAMGRRTASTARAEVWPSLQRLTQAIERIYADRNVLIDLAGDHHAVFRGERQDLEEMAGNLIDNAAKYGGGRVFVTVTRSGSFVDIIVEDDGAGIPVEQRETMFERGSRLDTGKAGTGLGLAIVRDVAGIYGGRVTLSQSEDLGGLQARLSLPTTDAA